MARSTPRNHANAGKLRFLVNLPSPTYPAPQCSLVRTMDASKAPRGENSWSLPMNINADTSTIFSETSLFVGENTSHSILSNPMESVDKLVAAQPGETSASSSGPFPIRYAQSLICQYTPPFQWKRNDSV